MKILIVGPKWMGGWLEGVLYPLNQLGHKVALFHYDYPNSPTSARNVVKVSGYTPYHLQSYLMPVAIKIGLAWEKRMNQKLVSFTKSIKADLVFILKGETIYAETITEIKALGAKVISWWLDDPFLYFHNHTHLQQQISNIDVLFMFDRGRFKELKKLGLKHIEYLACAYDPTVYRQIQVSRADIDKYQCDVGMIASYYPKRGELLKYLHGLDVVIWGMGWKNKPEITAFSKNIFRGKSLNGLETAIAYNIMKICPNAHHSQSAVGGLNMRTFEIPGAGGFQLTDYIEGMEEHFEIGKEIVVYQSPEHFRELAEYYLKHEKERKAIAKRGHERAMRDHTYEQRLKKIFEVLN